MEKTDTAHLVLNALDASSTAMRVVARARKLSGNAEAILTLTKRAESRRDFWLSQIASEALTRTLVAIETGQVFHAYKMAYHAWELALIQLNHVK